MTQPAAAPFAPLESPVDAVDLSARLIRCASVTPDEGGALVLLQAQLEAAGFACSRVDRNGIANLFARWGARGAARSFGFNGHTDVVPVGDHAAWRQDPFGGAIIAGELWGRGATDMKTGVAAFVAAACDYARAHAPRPDGAPDAAANDGRAIVLTITGDEEGAGRDGTRALLDWMAETGEAMSVCLVGEPTCPDHLGEMMKIGRRGSMTSYITVTGLQGHAAYPHRARNPLHALVAYLGQLTGEPLDGGTEHFEASSLQITTIDCGNPANNVIPARAQATVNIRFNDAHSAQSLTAHLQDTAQAIAKATGTEIAQRIEVSGDSFLTQPGPFVSLVADAVAAETGRQPVLSTSGGTSDARFVKDHCPVVEFGLVGKTMHQVDERIEISQIVALKAIYARILRAYLA